MSPVKSFVASFGAVREELGQAGIRCRFAWSCRLWGEGPESRDNVVGSGLGGLPIHNAVVLVQREKLPGSFNTRFRGFRREHTSKFVGGETECLVRDLLQHRSPQVPLELTGARRYERIRDGECQAGRGFVRGRMDMVGDEKCYRYHESGLSHPVQSLSNPQEAWEYSLLEYLTNQGRLGAFLNL